MYDTGVLRRAASDPRMPARPRPVDADDIAPLAQGDPHV
jgi:hypothetical protein